jgi:hypothetical protein
VTARGTAVEGEASGLGGSPQGEDFAVTSGGGQRWEPWPMPSGGISRGSRKISNSFEVLLPEVPKKGLARRSGRTSMATWALLSSGISQVAVKKRPSVLGSSFLARSRRRKRPHSPGASRSALLP